jgi:PAS domain S-box-containing protein
MKLRSYLVLLVVAGVLPVVIFACAMTYLSYQRHRENLAHGMIERARGISAALDREFLVSIQSLKVLAASTHLDKGQLSEFYADMKGALAAYSRAWQNITLTDSSGRQLINLRRPFGSPLPPTGNPEAIEQGRHSKEAAIANLSRGPVTGAPGIVVHLPVLRHGQVKYFLNAVLYPAPLTDLILHQKLPSSWIATIIDRNQVIVARTRDFEKFFGKPASSMFASQAKQYQEATWRGTTLDGLAVVAALHRSDFSGWTVGLASPAAEVDAPLRKSLMLTGAGGLVLLLAALALATSLGRRIEEPVSALSRAAEKLGRGETPEIPLSPIVEMSRLAHGLGNAATLRAQAEEQLRYQLQLSQNITDKAADSIFVSNDKGRAIFINPEAVKTFGFTAEELKAQPLHDKIHHQHPDGRPFPREECVLAQIHVTGKSVRNREEVFFRKDGSAVIVECSNAPLEVNGQRAGAVLMARDVTEHKKNEARIRQLNRIYAVLSDINQAIVRIRDPQTLLSAACRIAVEKGEFRLAWIGRIHPETGTVEPVAQAGFSNGYVEQLTIVPGYPQDEQESTGSAAREGMHIVCNDIERSPRAAPWRDEALRRGYRSSAAFALRMGDDVIGTFNLYSSEREFFTAEELTLLDELAADIGLALEIHRHESERLRAENSLRDSEERFRQLAENIREVFWLSTPDKNRIVYVSPAYETIWGRSCQSLYDSPRDWLDAIHPDDREQVLEAALREQQTGIYDKEYRIARPDGDIRWIRDRAFPVRDSRGEIYRVAGIAEDITERKEADEALRRARESLEEKINERTREITQANIKLRDLDRLKSEFLANMSHELRTPLNAIIGFSELMHDGKVGGQVSAEQKEYLGDILSSAKYLLQLINDVLDLSKVEAGRMEVLKSTFRIEEIISEVTQNVAPVMSVKGLKLIREIPPDLPPIVTDRRKLLQILLNLASNAVKFTDHGEIRIRCRIMPGTIELSVSDTGLGIKPEELPLLFQPFSQIDGSLRKRHEGTGLGLYLSDRLADLLGGDLTVESEYGKGSTFTIILPLAV